jgi:uncharacterized protein with ATP-grasp and redox domains
MATWTVDRLEYLESAEGQSKVVNVVHWCAAATSGDLKAERHATTTVEYKANDPFTAFDALTEAQVIGWVKGKMGEEWVDAIEAELAQELAQQPTVAQHLPWENAE